MPFDEVDEKGTSENVNKLLKSYHRHRRLSGLPADLVDDLLILDALTINDTEEDLSRSLQMEKQAQMVIQEIHRVLSVLSEQDSRRIKQRFILNSKIIEILNNEMISKATFYRQLNKAIVRFGEAYHGGELLAIASKRVDKNGV